ncbi:hypothetical protein PpBr36_01553 [Pyricularia pennisetigena]|uniref:hypothetical protein n=1 Tax=Pyricularia pennisetigena TaxID=1578925 RepID=UPI00114EECB0|nr:hypothetical protein PpBr36_01553 [Pyricularia pennisetigena]TLS29341.1 hypothetical protein PpBr36_01553 [Pyricularia pennisetigena]
MDPDNAKAPLSQSGSQMSLPCTENTLSALPTVDTVPHRAKLNSTTDAASVPRDQGSSLVASESTDPTLFPPAQSTPPLRDLVNERLFRATVGEPDLEPRIASSTKPHPIGPRPLGSHPVLLDRSSPITLENLEYESYLASLNRASLPPADQTASPLIDCSWEPPHSSDWPLKEEGIRSARAVRLRRPKAIQVTATSGAARREPLVVPYTAPSARALPCAPPLPPPHKESLQQVPWPPSVDNNRHCALPDKTRPRSSSFSEPDQAPPPLAIMNGMNGAGMGVGMVGPTPAGHQQELSHIYGMVDDLSSQLAENRRVLEEVVSLVGRIRARARHQNLSNQEIIAGADDPSTTENLDRLISILSETLEKALHERDANSELLQQYANVMANMVRQAHDHKARTVTDVSAWHRSYRQQLAEAREENARLREQIWDVQERAGRLNEAVRQFRTGYDADPSRYEARVENIALRQEVRFWKRMAMPEVPDDDPMWSDDDDLIDPAETARLAEVERAAAAMAASQHLAAQEEEENQIKEDERRAALEAAGGSSVGVDGAADGASQGQSGPQGGGPPGARGVLMQREGETS